MDLDTFQNLRDADVARIIRENGRGLVAVFPYNGTRRWFELEYPTLPREEYVDAYLAATSENIRTLCRIFFDHGVDTLLIPLLSPDTAGRGHGYMDKLGAVGLARLVEQPEFRDFYDEVDARVHFYGDYRKTLSGTPHANLSNLFEQIALDTKHHNSRRIFYAVFAQDETDTLSEFTVQYYQTHGKPPEKRELIEHYYGEYVEPVDLFIGFGKPRVFNMPLIASGQEGLYFTVSPSPYMTTTQLREILYDWLYCRRSTLKGSYTELPDDDRDFVSSYYRANIGRTLGIGTNKRSGFWYPTPQVKMPDNAE